MTKYRLSFWKSLPSAMIIALFLCLTIITPFRVFASGARLSWQNVGEINAQGDFTLGLSGEVPTSVSSFEFVITYDADQIEYMDYSFLIDGMNSGVDDSVPGAITFTADGGSLGEGAYDFANFNFKMKVAGDSSVTLARSFFTTVNGEEIPATMMLSHEVSLANLETTPTSTTAVTSSSSAGASSTSTKATVSSQTKAGETTVAKPESESSTTATSDKNEGSNLGVKLALLLGSLILIGLIFLILRLPRNNGRPRRR